MQQAKIFLADERGVFENEQHRICCTFNDDFYQFPHKIAPNPFVYFNEYTLAPQASIEIKVTEPLQLFILPIVGAVTVLNECLNTGQLKHFILSQTKFSLNNPTGELNNFLIFTLNNTVNIGNGIINFRLTQNKIENIYTADNIKINIIKMDGRAEASINTNNAENNILVFVLQGAFELAEILLHSRDALLLQNYQQIDLEALSNEAVLLVIECIH